MNNTRYIIIAVLVVIAGFVIYFWQIRPVVAPEPTTPLSDKQTSPATQTSELITITSPAPNQQITSPLKITGQARGNWFFEASAPVELIDANGNKIAQGNITTNGEWMTAEFVPFSATLTFNKPTTASGKLIFRKDNPSGLPENDDQIEIPIKF